MRKPVLDFFTSILWGKASLAVACLALFVSAPLSSMSKEKNDGLVQRQRISINDGWTFFKYDSASEADSLIYDVRPEIVGAKEYKVADAKPTEAVEVEAKQVVLKPWVLPSGNHFISDQAK